MIVNIHDQCKPWQEGTRYTRWHLGQSRSRLKQFTTHMNIHVSLSNTNLDLFSILINGHKTPSTVNSTAHIITSDTSAT